MKQTQLIPLEAKNAPLTVMRSALDKSIYQMAMKERPERPERQWKLFRYKNGILPSGIEWKAELCVIKARVTVKLVVKFRVSGQQTMEYKVKIGCGGLIKLFFKIWAKFWPCFVKTVIPSTLHARREAWGWPKTRSLWRPRMCNSSRNSQLSL